MKPSLSATVLAAREGGITGGQVFWIVVAMVAARSAAMGFNRLVDHAIDARNPRTASPQASFGAATGLVPLSEVERLQILYTLEMTENNKSKAARILGISRQTLREKLRIYESDAGASPRVDEAEA